MANNARNDTQFNTMTFHFHIIIRTNGNLCARFILQRQKGDGAAPNAPYIHLKRTILGEHFCTQT